MYSLKKIYFQSVNIRRYDARKFPRKLTKWIVDLKTDSFYSFTTKEVFVKGKGMLKLLLSNSYVITGISLITSG